jgi:PAS domain S-box-containing protein
VNGLTDNARAHGNAPPDQWGNHVFENSAVGIAIAEIDGRFLMANTAYQRMIGYTEAELREMTLPGVIEETDRPAVLDLLSQLVSGKIRQYQIENRHRCKEGRSIWVRKTVSLIPADPDSPAKVLVVGEDVTEGRRAADELRKQNEILQKMLDHIPLMISFMGPDGLIKQVNREWERVFGWTLEEIQSRGIDIFAERYPNRRDRREVKKFIASSRGGWAHFKTRVRDGRMLDTMWANVRLSDGTTIGIGIEITERIRTENALRRSEAYLEDSERLGNIGTWALNTSTLEITFWSKEHYRIFGFDPEKGLPTLDAVMNRIHPDDSAARDAIIRAVRGKKDFDVAYRILLPDGSVRYIHALGRPFVNRAGELVEFSGVSMDVTERKLAEQAVQRSLEQHRTLAARLESVREEERARLARTIHDDLGQILTGIKLDLRSEVDHPPPSRRARARRFQAILKLIDDAILSVRKIATELRPGILDDLGLVAAVEWAAQELAARTGAKCTLDLPREDLVTEPEAATALFRILQEALTNIARHAEATEFSVRLGEESGLLRLEVRDNGKGFHEARLPAGASLGIVGMRERALLLGGGLTIVSAPGEGAMIAASIPGRRKQRKAK